MIRVHIEVEEPDKAKLKADCDKFARIFCASVVRQGIDKIPKKIKEVMAEYYGEYDPEYYKYRTGSLGEDPYEIFATDEAGGVIAHGDAMYHPIKGVDEGTIFDWSFMSGYHGFGGFRNAPIVIGASPYKKIEEWMNDPAVQNEVMEEAERVAKSAGYTYLQFS